jgi:putative endonuclease
VYYAGITNDLDARFRAHVAGTGARFTRANPPQAILAVVPFPDRSSASKAEWALKQLPKAKKLAFMEGLARASEGLPEESPDGEEINEDLTQAQAPSI